jgi:hypothetical protein
LLTPDRPHSTLPKELLHHTPRAVVVAEGLVDEVQVEVVQLKPIERLVEGDLRPLVSGILDPELCGDEQLVPGHAAALQGVADCLFVQVGGRGVERSVTRFGRVENGLLALRKIAHLKDAEPEPWHLYAVVQCHELHGSSWSKQITARSHPIADRNLSMRLANVRLRTGLRKG